MKRLEGVIIDECLPRLYADFFSRLYSPAFPVIYVADEMMGMKDFELYYFAKNRNYAILTKDLKFSKWDDSIIFTELYTFSIIEKKLEGMLG